MYFANLHEAVHILLGSHLAFLSLDLIAAGQNRDTMNSTGNSTSEATYQMLGEEG